MWYKKYYEVNFFAKSKNHENIFQVNSISYKLVFKLVMTGIMFWWKEITF